MADYYTLLTDAGIAYETACKAAGTPIKLSQISVGDGGGTEYNPAATATALKREVWRGPLNALFQDENNPSWLLAEVTIPSDVGGWYVREAGIWTDTGILYAIVKYPESFKPVLATSGSGKEFYIRSIFETSNAELVTLLIDDTVVKATRAWVASYVADELAKLDRKQSVRVATTANIVLSGAQAIDGVAVIAGNRVLVKSQTLAKDNGIYVAANDAWVRAKDADASAEVTSGLIVSVEEGTTLANTIWQLITDGAIVLGTTGLAFQNITQGFAPINSPAFLGDPTASTASLFDSSKKIATTEFVERAKGNYRSIINATTSATLVAASAFGSMVSMIGTFNLTLPAANSGSSGGTISFRNRGAGTVTIVCAGADTIKSGTANKATMLVPSGATLELTTDGASGWWASGSAQFVDSSVLYQSTEFQNLMSGKISFGQLGLGSIGAPVLATFRAITPGGLYLAYGAQVPNLATPDAPPDSSGNVLGVLAVTPRSDCTYYFAFENGIHSANRRFWVGQYNLPSEALHWSGVLTTEQIATQPQVDAGVLDSVLITPKTMRWGVTYSLGQNGYIFLPSWLGGICIQWGYEVTNATGTTHSFPIAFPSSVFQIIGSDRGVITLETIALEVATTTQYRARSSGATPGFAYLAIGR